MGVIAGNLDFRDASISREWVMNVSHSVREYGPDGETIHHDKNVVLLYRPLHTTRESREECQPYRSAGGFLVLWDGRLDNRDDLIAELKAQLQFDRADVAVVAAAFERWGLDSFAKLIGDWAIAIWDPFQRELVLARDYIGIKQLFYQCSGHKAAWCNYLAPFVLFGEKLTLCDEYIAGYLAFYPDAHLTPYSEIHAVGPGTYVRIRDQRLHINSYWQLPKRMVRYKSDAEYAERYRELFRQSIRRRLRGNSHILAELSGGFDSSAVVCMADDIIKKENLDENCLDTFSFYDSNEPEEDDLLYFTSVESKRGKKGFHFDLRGSGDSFLTNDHSFAAVPGPGSRAEVRSALTEVIERYGYRVILSGFGGDQINGQTLDPRIQMADLLLHCRLLSLAKQLTEWSLLIRKRPLIQVLMQTLLQLIPIQLRALFKNPTTALPWVDADFAQKHNLSARLLEVLDGIWFVRPGTRDVMQTIATLSRNLSVYRPAVLEKRYPYLDRDLVEFVACIPSDQLLRPGQRRWLMRRAIGDLLPADVLNRNTKARVGRYPCVVIGKHWREIDEALSHCLIGRLGYVDSLKLRNALQDMKNGKLPRYVLRLINAISLEFWLRDLRAREIVTLPLDDYSLSIRGSQLVATTANQM